MSDQVTDGSGPSSLRGAIHFCLTHKVVVGFGVLLAITWGVAVAPFDWPLDWLPRQPVAVDAIPDIGENQQIVLTRWPGRSPQDIEDQIGYPLTVAMLGLPGVRTVRSQSMFGLSMIYVVFEDDIEFYWSRSRLLEKLNSLAAGTLPDGVQATLGPDATALGQVYWYTLEGRDEFGQAVGGWDLHELRAIQDWYVRHALLAADGIAEVASVGGHVQEYQIDVDPDAMRTHGVTLPQVFAAVKASNADVGARTIEINRAEYVVRGLGLLKNREDIENTVIRANDNVPLLIRHVGNVTLGPALRRGALDKGGAEAVGGVATVRYGANPLTSINSLKAKIAELAPGLPEKVVVNYRQVSSDGLREFAEKRGFTAYDGPALNHAEWLRWLDGTPDDRPSWLRRSKVTVVPFYDRTGLIHETLDTLSTALINQILVTLIVVLVMVLHLRSSLIIAITMPLAVLLCFVAMKLFKVDANVVALSGIAIAIGSIVDMAVIMCENIHRHLAEADPDEDRMAVVLRAANQVSGAILTAILTTIVSFLPVFTMLGAEGKLFRPLAFTKTFALLAAAGVALTVVPVLAHMLFRTRSRHQLPKVTVRYGHYLIAILVAVVLTRHWLPLGPSAGMVKNGLVVMGPMLLLLFLLAVFAKNYTVMLRTCLRHKVAFLTLPIAIVGLGLVSWLGAPKVFSWLPSSLQNTTVYAGLARIAPGLGQEFMPDLDEGSFLYMPTTMPHASIGEALDVLSKQDAAFAALPEVSSAVGKIGRAETALDPAPISMVETVITYHPEYLLAADDSVQRFKHQANETDLVRDTEGTPVPAADGEPYVGQGKFARDADGHLIPDPNGVAFRLWRPALDLTLNPERKAWPGIRDGDDIWQAIVDAGQVPGTTSAPKLQPIAARVVMLQSGMRAPMGVKIKGPDLATIEQVGLQIEKLIKAVPTVEPATVFAERMVGKPYLEIEIDREAIARHGMSVRAVQDIIEVAVGGRPLTQTIEGRERHSVRVRYQRERRDSLESLEQILVPGSNGQQVPLVQLADIRYVRGPQVLKSEDTFLVGYVLFDKKPGAAETDVVDACRRHLEDKLATGEWRLPAGVSFSFAGNYENQQRASKTLAIIIPAALLTIMLILYLQFKTIRLTLLVFSGIVVAWSGGFMLMWLYGQSWFLDMSLFGVNLREVYQVDTANISVAVWVGFLALFGIASDDGVLMTTYLRQRFEHLRPSSIDAIRQATVEAAQQRIRPCLVTSATTILALLPVLTGTGRGADIMLPMAIPSVGGMLVVLVSVFMVPVLFCMGQEYALQRNGAPSGP